MKIKKIVAPTMKDALRQIKLELGDDAIILKSRKVNKSGLFSFLSREQIEVTAAVDHQAPDNSPLLKSPGSSPRTADEGPTRRDRFLLYDIRDEVQRIDGALNEIGQKLKYDSMPGLPRELNKYYIDMVENGLENRLAADIAQEIYKNLNPSDYDDNAVIAKTVINALRNFFNTSGAVKFADGKPAVVALIGPTGVGKTTTIAKIASQYKFFANKKVGLISADTYRLAAVEQLRTFARIASIPLEVVYEAKDMPAAVRKLADKELILIDTAGRSHRDEEKMRELADFMESAHPSEIHLTLSAGTKISDLVDIVDRFRTVPSDYYLFTKLDETTAFGDILNLVHTRPKPLSMLTLGQNVPDDIALAEKTALAKLVLSRSLNEAGINKGINVRPSSQTERNRLV